jgi:hypothetical protein
MRMVDSARSLVPSAPVALACGSVLIAWIRLQPLPMPRTLQIVLAIGLVGAMAVVLVAAMLAAARDAERNAAGMTICSLKEDDL